MPDVGEQQRLLELVPGLVVDRAAAAHRGERPHERGAGLAQPVAEAGRLDDLDLVDDLGLGVLDLGTASASGSALRRRPASVARAAPVDARRRPAAPDAGRDLARARGVASGGTDRGRAR